MPRRRKPAGDPRRAARGATTPKRAAPARPRAAPVPRPRARAAPKRPTAERLIGRQISKQRTPPRTVAPRDVARPVQGAAPFKPGPAARRAASAHVRVSPQTPIGPARVPARGFATGGRSYGPVARKSLPSREVATKRAASSRLAARQAAQMRGPTGNLPIPESRAQAAGRIAAARNRAATRVRPQREPEQMRREQQMRQQQALMQERSVSPYVPPRGAVGISPRTSPGTPLGPAAPTQQQRAQQQRAALEMQEQARIAHAREGTGTRPAEGGGFWHRHE